MTDPATSGKQREASSVRASRSSAHSLGRFGIRTEIKPEKSIAAFVSPSTSTEEINAAVSKPSYDGVTVSAMNLSSRPAAFSFPSAAIISIR